MATSVVEASGKSRRKGQWLGLAFVAPNLIGFAIFTLLPLIFALAISFAQWDVVSGIDGIKWIGLDNFTTAFSDGKFWAAAWRTLIYVGFGVPLSTAAGMLIALALNGPVPGRGILRLIFFIPTIVNAVAISAVWILLYHPRYSPLNNTLRALGIDDPPVWLASSKYALIALIIMAVWGGCGYAAVIYLAGLQSLPTDLFEAAELDGAGVFHKFRTITFPLLTPTSFFLLVTGFIGQSQAFGMINLMTKGGPGDATTVASYYIYQNGFQFYKFGYAAALSWVMFIAVLLLTALLWIVQKRSVFYE